MREKFKKYKVSLILIFIIPILVNVLTLFIMNDKQLREIPMAVYMGDNTSVTRNIVNEFINNETFDVKYYVDSPNEIEKLMTVGKVFYGLIIPENFTSDLKKLKKPKILTVVDGSQLSSASFTKIKSSEILVTIKTGAMISVFEGKYSMSSDVALSTARPIATNVRVLGNPTRNYVNFLLPGFMTALVQIGIALMASTAAVKGKGKELYKSLVSNIAIYTFLGFASIMIIIFTQVAIFNVPFNSSILSVALLTLVFSFSVSSVSQLISVLVKDRVFASQIAAIWFLPSSILSGYTWPLSSMPIFYQKLAFFMPYTHYGELLRNLMLSGNVGIFNKNIILLLGIAFTSVLLLILFNVIGFKISFKEKEELSYEV